MIEKRSIRLIMAAFMALAVFMAIPVTSLAQTTAYKEQKPTAKLGDAEVDLFGPPGFNRVDGIDYDIDERLSVFHPQTSETLAVFAESSAWEPFFNEIFGNSPRDLAFYATIVTAPATTEFEAVRLSLDDLSALLKLYEINPEDGAVKSLPETGETFVTPLNAVSQGPRHISFSTQLQEVTQDKNGGGLKINKRYLAIISAVEIEGQILFLNIFVNQRGPQADKAEEMAANWRDAYLAKTKSQATKAE